LAGLRAGDFIRAEGAIIRQSSASKHFGEKLRRRPGILISRLNG
jgi:hypothetical protein